MTELPTTTKSKDLIIKHHKLGDIKLGKIPNNEKCRMIVQLLQEKQQTTKEITVANMLFNSLSKRTLNAAKKKVTEQIKAEAEAREKMAKAESKKKNVKTVENINTSK